MVGKVCKEEVNHHPYKHAERFRVETHMHTEAHIDGNKWSRERIEEKIRHRADMERKREREIGKKKRNGMGC